MDVYLLIINAKPGSGSAGYVDGVFAHREDAMKERQALLDSGYTVMNVTVQEHSVNENARQPS